MELTNEFEVGTEVEQAWTILTDVERIAPCLPGAELREIEGDEYRGVVKVKVGPISAEYRGAASFVELDKEGLRAVLRAEGREARGQGNASATITATLEPSGKGTKVTVVTDLSITGKVAQFGRGVLADVSTKLLGQFVDNLETMVLAGETHPSGNADDSASAGAPTAEDGGAAPARPARAKAGGTKKAAGQRAPRRAAATAEESGSGSGGSRAGESADSGGSASNGTAGESQSSSTAGEGATVRRLEPRPVEPVDIVEMAGGSIAKRLAPVVAVAAVLALLAAVLRRRHR